MDIATTAEDLADALAGEPCVLVPTMGALHSGHAELLTLARRLADDRDLPLAASIFVNPAQFNDQADLQNYPRPVAQDLDLMLSLGVEIAFLPSVEAVYPPDAPEAWPQPDLPAAATEPGLEDRFRPGHFAGVCRVVSRLFDLFDPEAAVFGEKDWQQLRVVSAMVEAQERLIEIIPCPTAREPDGLAMSSRNVHLTAEARGRAVGLHLGLVAAQLEQDPVRAAALLRERMLEAGFAIEYATIRDAATLCVEPVYGEGGPWRALAAGVLGGVRLLDNVPWPA